MAGEGRGEQRGGREELASAGTQEEIGGGLSFSHKGAFASAYSAIAQGYLCPRGRAKVHLDPNKNDSLLSTIFSASRKLAMGALYSSSLQLFFLCYLIATG